jgi:hypothetical protein
MNQLDSHDWIVILGSLASTIFVAGVIWGITKTQTKTIAQWLAKLEERMRHHVESEHPKLDDKIQAAQIDLAVVKHRTQSQVDRDERDRR